MQNIYKIANFNLKQSKMVKTLDQLDEIILLMQNKNFLKYTDEGYLPNLNTKSKNLSDVCSYIDKRSNSYDSADELYQEFKKLGLQTKVINEDNLVISTNDYQDNHKLISSRDCKSATADDNFLDYSNLAMKIKTGKPTGQQGTIKQKTLNKLKQLHKKLAQIKQQSQTKKKQIEAELRIGKRLMKQATDKICAEIGKHLIYSKQTFQKNFQTVNNQTKAQINTLMGTVRHKQEKIKVQERNLESMTRQKEMMEQQLWQTRKQNQQIATLRSQNQLLTHEHLSNQAEIAKLKITLEQMNGRLGEFKKNSSYQSRKQDEVTKNSGISTTKYLQIMRNFQEEINNLEEELRTLRRGQVQKEKMAQQIEEYEEHIMELQRIVEVCEQEKDELAKEKVRLRNKENQLLSRQSSIQIFQKMSQFDHLIKFKSPQKRLPYSNSTNGLYSPKTKASTSNLWKQSIERVQSKPLLMHSPDNKFSQNRGGIGTRIERIQNSLNRQLKSMGSRY